MDGMDFLLFSLLVVHMERKLLGLLLRDNINVEQIESLCGANPFAIVAAHFDRALAVPEMREIMRARHNYMRFPGYLATQGRHDLLDRLYGAEDWAGMEEPACGRMAQLALRAGHRATAEYVLARCPAAGRGSGRRSRTSTSRARWTRRIVRCGA